MVREKRNVLAFTECSVKSANFCCFHHLIENEATAMQRNRSAHTAWMKMNQSDNKESSN